MIKSQYWLARWYAHWLSSSSSSSQVGGIQCIVSHSHISVHYQKGHDTMVRTFLLGTGRWDTMYSTVELAITCTSTKHDPPLSMHVRSPQSYFHYNMTTGGRKNTHASNWHDSFSEVWMLASTVLSWQRQRLRHNAPRECWAGSMVSLGSDITMPHCCIVQELAISLAANKAWPG